MKNFTLLMAMACLSGTATAQSQFKQLVQKQHSKQVAGLKKEAGLRIAQVKEAKNSIYKPLLTEEWYNEEGDWLHVSDYYYTYDKKGNTKTEICDEDGFQLQTAYEYNDNDQWTSKTESEGEENEFVLTNKVTRNYDDVVKSLVVKSQEFQWDEEDWTLISQGRTWTRDVTRDAKGNITGVLVKTLFGDAYSDNRKTTITYNSDGLADSWKYEEITYNGEGYSLQEVYTLTDMEWYTTDGQITSEDINDFFTGNNRLKKALVTEPDYGVTGRITASYKENGDYTYKLEYFDEEQNVVEYDLFTHTITDENGSYKETSQYYICVDEESGEPLDEAEIMENTSLIVTFDEHGELLSELGYEGDELTGGAKYDQTYENGNLTETIISDYSYDDEDYIPFVKLVYKNYTDVTTAINTVKSNVATGSDQAVYNLQGIKVAETANSLPAGLYIVKKDGRTIKVMKR